MFDAQEFIDVYDGKLEFGGSNKDHCTCHFKTGIIHYIDYSEKMEIKIPTYSDEKYSYKSMTYDECMDWVVFYCRGLYGIQHVRVHCKEVSKGQHPIITPEVLNRIKRIREDFLMDRLWLDLRTGNGG